MKKSFLISEMPLTLKLNCAVFTSSLMYSVASQNMCSSFFLQQFTIYCEWFMLYLHELKNLLVL